MTPQSIQLKNNKTQMNIDKVCPEDFLCFYLNLEAQLSLFVTRPPCGVKLSEGPIPYGNILISLVVALLTINS